MKEKNNCSGHIKVYDPITELKPLLILTKVEEEIYESYRAASVNEKNKFWKPLYKAM